MQNEYIDRHRISEIIARFEATENGMWQAMIEGRDHYSGSSCLLKKNGAIDFDGATDSDIEFMANAHQDIPYLISELQRLEKLVLQKIKS